MARLVSDRLIAVCSTAFILTVTIIGTLAKSAG
jgi:hypothetical protein